MDMLYTVGIQIKKHGCEKWFQRLHPSHSLFLFAGRCILAVFIGHSKRYSTSYEPPKLESDIKYHFYVACGKMLDDMLGSTNQDTGTSQALSTIAILAVKYPVTIIISHNQHFPANIHDRKALKVS
ncbi:16254_t:CDS:1 [Acaulospora colombiana]|uniref:16254_t:CDS:1 n=1 Tax=Acaulospora colombiana TaxID=27376 RepID=A0ACA9P7N8_9GLOM|nr:16254_t:CDS:1 [Acaulospora colombiana]